MGHSSRRLDYDQQKIEVWTSILMVIPSKGCCFMVKSRQLGKLDGDILSMKVASQTYKVVQQHILDWLPNTDTYGSSTLIWKGGSQKPQSLRNCTWWVNKLLKKLKGGGRK